MTSKRRDPIKVIIADDHPIVREGFVQIISETSDLTVVGEAENGVELLDKIRELDLDLVVMDMDMPKKSGWDVIAQLKIENPELPVIVLSAATEEDHAIEFFRAGVSGFLNKMRPPKLLLEAIRKVAQGGKYISPELAEKLAFDLANTKDKRPYETLSPREFQVFCMIASGKTIGEISEEIALSVPTVSTYRARILEKMSMKTNAQITNYAYKHGILK